MLLRQAPGGLKAHLVGAEIHPPNAAFVRRFNIYDDVWEGDITKRDDLGQFDIVIACEVLEHLTRTDSEDLLARLEFATLNTIIVSTPNGPDLRGPIGANESEAHLSAWSVKDFRSRGYEVRGVGSRLHRGKHLGRLTAVAWHASTPFASHWPGIAGNIVAVKRIAAGRPTPTGYPQNGPGPDRQRESRAPDGD
jgi:hypothetical protein